LAATLEACRFALAAAQLHHPTLERAINCLEGSHPPTDEERTRMAVVAEQMDQDALEIMRAADEGRASREEYLAAFSQARAASAVLWALAHDPLVAAAEAIYEAAATTDEPKELLSRIHAALPQR